MIVYYLAFTTLFFTGLVFTLWGQIEEAERKVDPPVLVQLTLLCCTAIWSMILLLIYSGSLANNYENYL